MATAGDRPPISLATINMDCHDPHAMADFYGKLLGWEVLWRGPGRDFLIVGDPSGGTRISFQQYDDYEPPVWPEEPGALRKMIHLDLRVENVEEATAFAISCGARLAEYQGREDLRVLLDPAGHPFCLFKD
jgi:catechol 2,3-dioxygenase-like lactoylglutathione lyase family enzyme